MKTIFGLMGVFILTLLPLTLHAADVDYMVVKQDTFSGAKNLDSLDELIRALTHPIDTYFKPKNKNQDGNLRLDSDRALIIRGGAKDLLGKNWISTKTGLYRIILNDYL
jgi:hypothetical protein